MVALVKCTNMHWLYSWIYLFKTHIVMVNATHICTYMWVVTIAFTIESIPSRIIWNIFNKLILSKVTPITIIPTK